MKKGFVLLLLAVFASSITLFAQDNDKVKKDRPTKEERIEMMTKRMSSKLMLNDSQSAKFASVYKNYLNEIQELRPQKAEIKGKIDDAQRDKMTREGFAHQRKMIDLKEKYYNEFSKFLTPAQAQKIIAPMNGNMKNGKMRDGKMKEGKFMRPDGKMKMSADRNRDRERNVKIDVNDKK
jgi:Spy/CpxP family protein refolding chaperone